MAWDPINEAELTPGGAILKHMRQAWNCLKFLFGQIGTIASTGVQNGSFEVDSDGNGQPDNWTLSTYLGGAGTLVTDAPAHGAKALRLTHPGGAGNGGGYYESDYVICSSLIKAFHGFVHWASAAGMHNKVVVRYFDKAKVYLSSADLYDSTDNPTTPTYFIVAFQPPANARYYKLQLIGGHSDTDVAGAAYFDGVGPVGMELFSPRYASATIDEVSSSEAGYLDVASITFRSTHLGLPARVYLPAEGSQVTGAAEGLMRFRCGSNYSNEFMPTAVHPDYSSANFILDIPSVGESAQVTVHLQLYASFGGIYGRKAVPDISILTTFQ